MSKEWITSGEAIPLFRLNKRPVNPRTFEKILKMAKVKPVYVQETTKTRFFSRKQILGVVKRLPPELKRGQTLKLK